jgi:hypothetical protein
MNLVGSLATKEPVGRGVPSYVAGRTLGSLDLNKHLGGSDAFIVRYNIFGEQQ